VSDTVQPLRLNIGAGTEVKLPGFTSIDRANGQEAFPLAYPDGSVEEIYASHILEHFPAANTENVIKEWVRVLKPGGRIRIAVPDFAYIAKAYLAGIEMPIGPYVMGGQTDANDFHQALFDEAGLRWQMEKAGLVGIQKWKSDATDCACLPVSLNLEGIKPIDPNALGARVGVVATMPRLNWTYNRDMTTRACLALGVSYTCMTGAYFDQGMERALESAMDKEFIIAIDYDTVFTPDDVKRLVVLADKYPEAGAIAAMQAKRGPGSVALMARDTVPTEADVSGDIFPVKSAHFGLTLFRTSALRKMSKPWLHHTPAPDGTWGDGRIDADIAFWHKLNEVSQAYITPRVNVGHLQVMVSWVDCQWKTINQHWDDYNKSGKPAEVRG
jgi:hypothetical protein